MQVRPGGGVGGVIRRLAALRQTGDDAEGHFACRALAIEDRLVNGQADGLGDHLHDPGGEVDVVVLKEGIAHRDVTGHLVAVERDLVKSKGQLIDRAAHLGPHGLRHGARDGLAGLAVDVADADPVEQLAVAVHILRDEVQHDDGDRQLAAGKCPALAPHASELAEECLDVLLCQDRGALLHRQGVKGPAAHGERADIKAHGVGSPFSFRCLGHLSAAFGFGELFLQLLDFAAQARHLAAVRGLFSLQRLDLRTDRLELLVGLRLVDCGLQRRPALRKRGVLLPQLFELAPLRFDLPAEHDCSKCHGVLLSAVP